MNSLVCWFISTRLGRSIELQALTHLVTSSLSLHSKCVLFMSPDKALETFASLTAEHLPHTTLEQQKHLSDNAYRLGHLLRRVLSDRSDKALCSLVFRLYQSIGIKMSGSLPGDVIVTRCYFCRHYSPTICAIASMMDSGVICGLYGGGTFHFSQRITEGYNVCRCCLKSQIANKFVNRQ